MCRGNDGFGCATRVEGGGRTKMVLAVGLEVEVGLDLGWWVELGLAGRMNGMSTFLR
jgi:hypothetical protein